MSIEKVLSYITDYGLKAICVIVIIIIGFWLAKKIAQIITKLLANKDIDESLRKFLAQLITFLLKVLVIFSAAETVGLKTTSFLAVLGGAALAIGLALQGSLANFAGGVMILLFKPFRIGDLIESQGFVGVVKEIEIFNTILTNPENKKVVLPNGSLYNNPIINYSENGFVRVDVSVGIDYKENIQRAREILIQAAKNIPEVLQDQGVTVHVNSLGDSSINLTVRCFTKTNDHWTVFYSMTEIANNQLSQNQVKIPYPHTEVILHKES